MILRCRKEQITVVIVLYTCDGALMPLEKNGSLEAGNERREVDSAAGIQRVGEREDREGDSKEETRVRM